MELKQETFGKSFIKKPFLLTQKTLGKKSLTAKPFALQKPWEKIASQKKGAIHKLYMPQKKVKNRKRFTIGCWEIELTRRKTGKNAQNFSRGYEKIAALRNKMQEAGAKKFAAAGELAAGLNKRMKQPAEKNLRAIHCQLSELKKKMKETNLMNAINEKVTLMKKRVKTNDLTAKPKNKQGSCQKNTVTTAKKNKIAEMLSSEGSKKSAPEAGLAAIFAWFVAALLLNNILLGALYALAAFFAAFGLLLYYPAIKKKNYAKRVEAQLPFVLLDIAIELNLGIDFLRCLQHAAKQRGEAANEFRKAVIAIERQGATVQDAMLQMAARVNSRMLNRSIVQLVAAFEQGAKQAAGEPIKKIAAEILSRQKIESKLFAGKLVVLSLLFIAISAIVPALFQSFTIVGSMVLKTRFTAMQVFLIIVLLFPLLDLLVLFYIKSKTPVFLRG